MVEAFLVVPDLEIAIHNRGHESARFVSYNHGSK